MTVSIGVSAFIADATIGMVSGELDPAAVPQAGNIVCLSGPPAGVERLGGFSGHLTVKYLPLRSATEDGGVMITFEGICADSRETALEIMLYLERGFGLFADAFEA
ncbi:hypothetical protein ACNHKD_02020 [Methylocystis sp. JAN1]|uniref:hypothetical protein n=1 Tax=Methylocystis sp. JAN1 TaxID=3397211 RepID=UPI003FA325CC